MNNTQKNLITKINIAANAIARYNLTGSGNYFISGSRKIEKIALENVFENNNQIIQAGEKYLVDFSLYNFMIGELNKQNVFNLNNVYLGTFETNIFGTIEDVRILKLNEIFEE